MLNKGGTSKGVSENCTTPHTPTHETNRPATTAGHSNPPSMPTLDTPALLNPGAVSPSTAAGATPISSTCTAPPVTPNILDPPERCGGGATAGLPVAAAANTLATAVYAGFFLNSLSNKHASPSPGNVFGIHEYLSVNCHTTIPTHLGTSKHACTTPT